jgi:putative transposase
MCEIRRRTRVVGAFPDGQIALTLVAAGLRPVAGTKWRMRKHLDMGRLAEGREANVDFSGGNKRENQTELRA